MTDPIGERLRQYDFDFCPEPVQPACLLPPRLLILACSNTKAEGEGLAARDRYDGPLWQTLRAVDPDGSRVFVAYLSAKYGLGDARSPLPSYNAVLNARSAEAMAAAGIGELYPAVKLDQKTDAGRARALAAVGKRNTAFLTGLRLTRELGQPFRDVAVCGGKHYVGVGRAFVAGMTEVGQVAADAPLTIINDQIGYMRAALRAWIVGAN